MKPKKKPKKGVPKHHLPELPKHSPLQKKFEAKKANSLQAKFEAKKAKEPAKKVTPEKETGEKKPALFSKLFKKKDKPPEKETEKPKEAALKQEVKPSPKPSEEPVPETKEVSKTEEKAVPKTEEKPAQKESKAKGKPAPAKKLPGQPVEKPSLGARIKGFFVKDKETADKEKRAEQIIKGIRGQKKKRKKLQRKSLQQYLDKAGFEADAERLKKLTYQVVIAIFLAGTAFMLFRFGCWGDNACSAAGVWKTLGFFAALWSVVFVAGIITAIGIVYFYLDYRIYKRTRELEEVLADFLQLASANIAAGMPIDRALWYSIRPSFGVLAKEMEEVAKATMSGESLEDSLVAFGRKYDSKLLKRSISILIEGLHSGGELADLLNKIALNIDEIKIMKKEMAANVTTYAIFIIVAAVGIAPILFALATQLLSIIVTITGSLDLGSTSGFFTISAVEPEIIGNFSTYSYMMLIVSSLFGASIVSVIQRGNVMEGIKTIPVYALVAVLMYTFGLSFFSGIFGGII